MSAIPTPTRSSPQRSLAQPAPMPAERANAACPIPVWDTATHPAEWEEYEYEELHEGHAQILSYVMANLEHLGPPTWHIVPKRGMYFADGQGHPRRVIPDLAIYPRRLADPSGALRYDVPCAQRPPPPLWILEIVSPASVARDVQDKKAWYLHIGVQEYWLCDPGGDLLQSPLQGWCLEEGSPAYKALPVTWQAATQRWEAFSPLLTQDLLMPATRPDWIWARTYHGLRFRDPATGQVVPTYQERWILLERQQDMIRQQADTLQRQQDTIQRLATLRQQQDTIRQQQDDLQRVHQAGIVFLIEIRYDKPWDTRVQEALRQCPSTAWPALDQVRQWTRRHDDALACLNALRTYLGLPPWPAVD